MGCCIGWKGDGGVIVSRFVRASGCAGGERAFLWRLHGKEEGLPRKL